MTLRFSAIATAFALTASMANAHATWIGQHAGAWVVIHGEGSATDEAYEPSIVKAPLGFDKAGAKVEVAIAPATSNVSLTVPETAAVLAVTYEEGWWTEDAAGEWHNETAEAFPDFKGTGNYTTFAVAYIGNTDVQKPVGHSLEIVPLSDPTKLAMGDKLEVQVLLDGKPVSGVVVTNDILTDWDIGSTLTDSEGKAYVTVANNGLNVLQYYHEVETGEKEIKGSQAVLSFVAGQTEGE
jgi:nickel transport protein